MTIDPTVAALAATITAIAGVLYRELVKSRDQAKAEAAEWKAHYFRQVGMTDMAVEVAEKRS